MATAVVQLELKNRSYPIKVPGNYTRALVLLKWAGRPVGRISLPVVNNEIDRELLERQMAASANWDFWYAWLHDSLAWDESESGNKPHAVTVAVCTRNRAEQLRTCLEALHGLPDDGQEMLVVDNNPSDESTAHVVRLFPRVRYVRQMEGGLDAARNRAMREARGEVVAFTDDDAYVDAGWLRAIVRNFDDPRVLCVTGLIMPVELETEAQEMFEEYSTFCKGFWRRVFHVGEMNPMAVGQVGSGANSAFRKDALDLVGEFDEALDGGTASRSGGDHDMFARILSSGYRIVYDPAALNWHRHRRSMDELRETLEGYGTGVYAMFTAALLRNRELSVFKPALLWLRHGQVPGLVAALRPKTRRVPLRMLLAELRGCLLGPRAYLKARKAGRDRRGKVAATATPNEESRAKPMDSRAPSKRNSRTTCGSAW